MKTKLLELLQVFILFVALVKVMNAQCPTDGLFITEFVYDVCDESHLGETISASAEYFILTNNGTTSININGAEFDDDGDVTNGDGEILTYSNSINPGGCLVVSGISLFDWESEYGPLANSGCAYFQTSSWDALNNSGGDNIGVTGACNNGSYSDLASDGEVMIWDGTSFVNGGIVSITDGCGPQTYVPGGCPLITSIELINFSDCINGGNDSYSENDFFTTDIEVCYINPPSTGTMTLIGTVYDTSSLIVPVSALSGNSCYTFTDLMVPSNYNPVGYTALFEGDGLDCQGGMHFDFSSREPCSFCQDDFFNVDPNLLTVTVIDESCDARGSITEPATNPCPEGSTLKYSTDLNQWDTIIPAYDPYSAQTIYSACLCNDRDYLYGNFSEVTTDPELCSECPDLSGLTPDDVAVVIIESVCQADSTSLGGGSIDAPATDPCPPGSALVYSLNYGSFTPTVPTYSQYNSFDIISRCQCFTDSSNSSEWSIVSTVPGECPPCRIDVTLTLTSDCINVGNDDNPYNDVYFGDVTVTFPDATGSGYLFLDINGESFYVDGDDFDSSTSHSFIGVSINAGESFYANVDIDGLDCEVVVNEVPLYNCSTCTIKSVEFSDVTPCVNGGNNNNIFDDYVTVDLNICVLHPPTSGTLDIGGTFGSVQIPVSDIVGDSLVVEDLQIPANGNTQNFYYEFSDGDCFFDNFIEAIEPCSDNPTCEIEAIEANFTSDCINGGDDDNPGNDYFLSDIFVTFNNPPDSGFFYLTGDVSDTLAMSPGLDEYNFDDLSFPADGDTICITGHFSEEPTCELSVKLGPAPESCSIECGSLTCEVSITEDPCVDSSGDATVSVDGGTAPYTYLWNTGDTSITVGTLPGGTWTVIVTDANGCTSTCEGIIPDVLPLSCSTTTTDSSCGENNGTATVTVSLGTAPYSYVWSNSATTAVNTNLAAGTYTVTITDANGCSLSCSTDVQNDSDLTLSFLVVDTRCGEENGVAQALVNFGTQPYSYLWNNGATTFTVPNLSAGTYSVTVTDSAGCSLENSGLIASSTSITCSITSTPSTCDESNGTITATIVGGVGPFTYNWSTGLVAIGTPDNTYGITNLPTGSYSVTIEDSNGCSAVCSGMINGSDSPTLTIDDPTICYDGSTLYDLTSLEPAGMTGGTWTDYMEDAISSTMITPGDGHEYNYTYVNANGCSATATITLSVNSAPPATIEDITICEGLTTEAIVLSSSNADNANLSHYKLDFDAAAETAEFVDQPTIASLTDGVVTIPAGAAVGTYTGEVCLVYDNECQVTDQFTITVESCCDLSSINEGAFIQGCRSVIGGPSIADYTLSDAEDIIFGDVDGDGMDGSVATVTYYATQADALACTNALPINSTMSNNDIYAKVEFSDGCSGVTLIEVRQRTGPTYTVEEITAPECDVDTNGKIVFSGFQTSRGILVEYTDPSGNLVNLATSSTAEGKVCLSGLSSGSYSGLRFYLSNLGLNCYGDPVTVEVPQPTCCTVPINDDAFIRACEDPTGSFMADFNLSDAEDIANGDVDGDGMDGSTATVTYYATQADAIACTNPLSNGMDLSTNDIYAKVELPDGCSSVVLVDIQQFRGPEYTAMTADPECGPTSGRIDFSGFLASAGYFIEYTDPAGNHVTFPISTSPTGEYALTGLTAGTYTDVRFYLSVFGLSCYGTSLDIAVETLPAPPAEIEDIVLCQGENTADITLSSGNADNANLSNFKLNFDTAAKTAGFVDQPENASLTNGTISIPSELAAGTYNGEICLVYDNECQVTDPFTITVLALPSLSDASVCMGSSVTMTGIGNPNATDPYMSSVPAIATVTSGGVITPVAVGTTIITYTDENGCQATGNLTVHSLPQASAGVMPQMCMGSADFTITGSPVPAAGETGTWSAGSGILSNIDAATGMVTFNASSLVAGTYPVTYTFVDANGCEASDMGTVLIHTSALLSGESSICEGGTLDLSGSGVAASTDPYTSSDTGVATVSSEGTVTGVSAGTTIITYTDENSCTATQSITVLELPSLDDVIVCEGATVPMISSGTAHATDPYISADPSIATVSATGEITGVMAGSTTISYTDENGCQTTATATVVEMPTSSFIEDVLTCGSESVFPFVLNDPGGTLSHFLVNFDALANAAGLQDVSTITSTTGGQFNCTGILPVGTYNGMVTLVSSSGCVVEHGFSITVRGTGCNGSAFPWNGSN